MGEAGFLIRVGDVRLRFSRGGVGVRMTGLLALSVEARDKSGDQIGQ